MTQQQKDFASTFCARQFTTQWDNACASIKNDRTISRLHFNTGCIAAKLHRLRTRRRITPTHTPKPDFHFVRHPAPPHFIFCYSLNSTYTLIIVCREISSRKVFAWMVGNISQHFYPSLRANDSERSNLQPCDGDCFVGLRPRAMRLPHKIRKFVLYSALCP